MREIFDLLFNLADILTLPFRVFFWFIFSIYVTATQNIISTIFWVLFLPFRTIASSFRETQTERRLVFLQSEFDKLTASLIQLEAKLEVEKEKRWNTVEKLQKALQQRNFLKKRVHDLELQIAELHMARAEAEENANLAKSAEALAEADVIRASRLLSHYLETQQELEKKGERKGDSRTLGAQKSSSSLLTSSQLPDNNEEGGEEEDDAREEEIMRETRDFINSSGVGKHSEGPNGNSLETNYLVATRNGGARKASVSGPLAWSNILSSLLCIFFTLYLRKVVTADGIQFFWLFFFLTCASLWNNSYVYRTKYFGRAIFLQNLVWSLFGALVAVAWISHFSTKEGLENNSLVLPKTDLDACTSITVSGV